MGDESNKRRDGAKQKLGFSAFTPPLF